MVYLLNVCMIDIYNIFKRSQEMAMLKKQMSQISIISDNSFLDETSIVGSSECSKRLCRKTNQSTASRRSLSRRSSSKSEQKPDMNCFFIKMSSLNLSTENTLTSTRNNLLLRDQNNREKKRSPTPNPGYLMRKRQKERQNNKKQLQIEDQMRLAQLQNKYNSQRQKTLRYQRRIQQLQKEIKLKIRKIEEMQILIVNYQQKQKDMAAKLTKFQEIVVQNESNLSQTKSKLQRLKNTIKINRYSQLEVDNGKLRKEKQKMAKKIKQLENENKDIDDKCIFLEKELFIIKKKSQVPRQSSIGKGDKNDNWTNMLKSRDCYIQKLQEKIAKLEIKLNFMNRKKLEEISKYKDKRDEQAHKLRTKIVYMNTQLQSLRLQNEKLLLKQPKQKQPHSEKLIHLTRANSFLSNNSPSKHEQIFCLSLSPEHH